MTAYSTLFFVVTALAQPEPSPPQMLDDAELTSVTFIDADRGWAVGDRGVIWHTSDGGRAWKLQPSGVTCRLEAVQFLDADNGFVVGGWTQPYTHQTHGVVLRTHDGGRTWQNTPDLTLPALKHARFFDAKHGSALGDSSPLYPAGVFRTQDGGRSWIPIPKGQSIGWATGDFRDQQSGALAAVDGTLAIATSTEIRAARPLSVGARSLHRLLLSGPTGGWLVGDGGLVVTTQDGGLTWTSPPSPLPELAARHFDFHAVAASGAHVWIAGSPGSLVMHSPDAGKTWQALPTDYTTPLRSLAFIDEYRGWAVGALGTILHTRDGGRSWRVQRSERSGAARAALLGVFGEAHRMPLDVVADQGGNSGFLTAMEILGRPEPPALSSGTAEWSLPARTHAAVVAAGGSAAATAWRFPLPTMQLSPTSEAILARWNAANDGQATQRLEEHLVKKIRQWRPEVIVTDEVSPQGESPLAHLTGQLTLAAVAKAAEDTAYPEQIRDAGLASWKVKKVLTMLPAGKQGTVNLTPSQWAERLGCSLEEQAQTGRALLSHENRPRPISVGMAVRVDRLPQDSGKRDVMSGIVLAPGSEARRRLADPPSGDLKRMADVAQKRHNAMQLLARMETNANLGAGWLGQVKDLTGGLGSKMAGDLIWQLGRKYQLGGKLPEAAEAMELLLEKHPQHPLADAAALWLVHYYASGEVAWRMRQSTKFEVRLATATAVGEAGVSHAGFPATASKQNPPSVAPFASIGAAGSAAPDLAPAERAGRALRVGKQIEQTRPTIYADPALRFALAAAARQAGQPRTADRWFQVLANGGADTVWAQNAAAEQWLFRPSEIAPKKVCSVVSASQKPRLDGLLDDPLWQTAKPVSLRSTPPVPDEIPAVVAMTYDDEFLYFAISCPRASSIDYATTTAANSATRVPDTDLSGHDRVTIMLDVDRDYATYWSLTVDHRGWPAESCFHDKTWNPQWFIATGGDEQFWTIEAAVPLAELTQAKPKVRDVWTLGIQRTIPRLGLQSFSLPAAVDVVPEGMGLLVFE